MFKLVFVAIVLGFVSMVQCGPMPEQRIDGGQNRRQEQQKYAVDHFTTGLVGNPKIRENYLNCFLDKGPCSPEAKNIKRKYTLEFTEIIKTIYKKRGRVGNHSAVQ